jgi:hypothetical protein
MTNPWEALPGESSKAYRAFCLYRDMGPNRSLDQASRDYHRRSDQPTNGSERKTRASGTIRGWAQRWNWPGRALAWDRELDRVQHEKQKTANAEMGERHAREAMLLQQKGVERLRLLRAEDLSPREALSYLIEAAKLERLARGEPTERVAEEHHFPDVKELSDEELSRIIVRGQELSSPGGRGAAAAKDGPPQPI